MRSDLNDNVFLNKKIIHAKQTEWMFWNEFWNVKDIL